MFKKGNKNQYAYAHHHIEVDGWYTPTTVASCQKEEPICLLDISSARFMSHPHLATRLMASFFIFKKFPEFFF